MNIFFADGDGASLPPSKVQLATERHLSTAHSARAQHRLLEEMDRAMSEDLETRLRSLLELANQRESRQQLPDGVVARLSRLHRPPEELASEPRDWQGFCRVTPIAATLRRQSGLARFFTAQKDLFVRASLLSDSPSEEPAMSSAASPAMRDGGDRPLWTTTTTTSADSKRSDGGGADGVCALCLPFPDYTKMRPILRLRLEVLAMDSANILKHVLLASADIQIVVQPSLPTMVSVPLTPPPGYHQEPFLGAAVGVVGASSATKEHLLAEITIVAEDAAADDDDKGIVSSPSTSPLPPPPSKGMKRDFSTFLRPLIWVRVRDRIASRNNRGTYDNDGNDDDDEGDGDEYSSSSNEECDDDGHHRNVAEDTGESSQADANGAGKDGRVAAKGSSTPVLFSSSLPEQPRGGAWVLWPASETQASSPTEAVEAAAAAAAAAAR